MNPAMKSYTIAVAGTGYVGLVAGVCFAEKGHRVTCVDVDDEKVNRMKAGLPPICEPGLETLMKKNHEAGRLFFTTEYQSAYRQADVIFIGVGTPAMPDGSAGLSAVAAVARQIAESVEKDCLVVVKSTVPVGTNEKVERLIKEFLVRQVHVEVASNPEFLSQGTAVRDTLEGARVVIGTESLWAEQLLKAIYEPFGLPIVSVGRSSAEMIKYAANNFLALKLSYMNEIANLCELVGADIEQVAQGMAYDRRIGPQFLKAGIGYGGSCFPKDSLALKHLAHSHGMLLRTVAASIEINRHQKTLLFRKAAKRLMTFKNLKVAILGLTYKPGTDDLREAPSLDNIRLLLEQGAGLYAYDPLGAEACKRQYPQLIYTASPEEALNDAQICFIFTEWEQIRALKPEAFKTLMHTPLVYDGRNLYSVSEMKEAQVEYHSVGRP